MQSDVPKYPGMFLRDDPFQGPDLIDMSIELIQLAVGIVLQNGHIMSQYGHPVFPLPAYPNKPIDLLLQPQLVDPQMLNRPF